MRVGIYGDMHGIIGASFSQIKMLEPSEGVAEEHEGSVE